MRIAVINHKGGVGKTTIACSVAFLAKEKRVSYCLLDNDRQRNAMQWLSGHTWTGQQSSLFISKEVLITTDVNIAVQSNNLIIDCSPGYGQLDSISKLDIDVYIIPVESRFSIGGAYEMTDKIFSINTNSRIILVMNKAKNSAVTQIDRIEIAKMEGIELWKYAIPEAGRGDGIRKSEQQGIAPWRGNLVHNSGRRLKDLAGYILVGCPSVGTYKGVEKKIFAEERVISRGGNYGKWI